MGSYDFFFYNLLMKSYYSFVRNVRYHLIIYFLKRSMGRRVGTLLKKDAWYSRIAVVGGGGVASKRGERVRYVV